MSSIYIPQYAQPYDQRRIYYYEDGSSITIEYLNNSNMHENWELFFQNYVKINENTYNDNPSYYNSLFFNYYEDYQANHSSQTWEAFLNKSDITQRQTSPFMWAFAILLSLLSEIQENAINEIKQVSSLTNAEQANIESLKNVDFTEPSNSENITAFYANQVAQKNEQVYLSWQDLIDSQLSKAENIVDSANQSVSGHNTLMSGLIEQMQSILTQMFS